jgi:ATP-dependent helicase HepA
MLQEAENITQNKQESLIQSAQVAVKSEMNNEISRLQALRQVNPNVRQEEIDYLQQRMAASLHFLSLAKIRLDSLRVIMTI